MCSTLVVDYFAANVRAALYGKRYEGKLGVKGLPAWIGEFWYLGFCGLVYVATLFFMLFVVT